MKKSLANAAKGLVTGGIAALLASGAYAAVDGVPGFSSTGTLDISITVDDEVRISNLGDILLGTFAGTDATGSSAACIYRNSATTYQITASGDGTANAFTLSDGTGTVPYSVTYADASATPVSVASGIALTGQDGADTDVDCAVTGNNASIGVTVSAADAAALPAGNYTGTLTLVVAPN